MASGIRLNCPMPISKTSAAAKRWARLQKVRTDVEKLINIGVSLFFTTIIGVVFVMIYSARVYWAIGPAYLLTIPMLGGLSSLLSKKIKTVQQVIVKETTALAGSTTESLRNIELVKSLGLAQQEIGRLNATTAKILRLELKKVRYLRSLSFMQGTFVNLLRTMHSVFDDVSDFPASDDARRLHGAVHLFVFHLSGRCRNWATWSILIAKRKFRCRILRPSLR